MRMLVTGGNGFVARRLAQRVLSGGDEVRLSVRRPYDDLPAPFCVVGDVDDRTDWGEALSDIDVVVHLAAQTVDENMDEATARERYDRVNRLGTKRLAESCADGGVRRIVFMSSILACADNATLDEAISDDDRPPADDFYGWSKREAEVALEEAVSGSDVETVILRPGPVYGPGLQNGIVELIAAVRNGRPLPFRSVRNRLDFVFVENLVSAIVAASSHPAAAGKRYFVSDQDPVSTPEFIRCIAEAFRKRAVLLPCPVWGLRLLGFLSGRRLAIGRLVNSLHIDSRALSEELGWRPEYSLRTGLKNTVDWILSNDSRKEIGA